MPITYYPFAFIYEKHIHLPLSSGVFLNPESCLHAFISLMPITYYPLAFIYEKHIQYCHCMGGNTSPYLELVYQYTTF